MGAAFERFFKNINDFSKNISVSPVVGEIKKTRLQCGNKKLLPVILSVVSTAGENVEFFLTSKTRFPKGKSMQNHENFRLRRHLEIFPRHSINKEILINPPPLFKNLKKQGGG